MRLTEEQKELAMSAYPLAFKLMLRSALCRIDREYAEEVAMGALIRCARNYDPSRGVKFVTYAGTSVRLTLDRYLQLVINKQTRRGKRVTILPLLDREPPARPEPHTLAIEDRARTLRREIARLTPAEREAVELRYFQGLRLCQIATRLGVTHQAIATRLRRAIERLRDASHLLDR